MKYLIFIIPVLFLMGCGSTTLVSSNTESSSDTTITITPHIVNSDPITDNPTPTWVSATPQVDSLIANKDTSQIVLEVHNRQGRVIGKVSVKPFTGQSSVNIQPNSIRYNDTTTKIRDSKNITNNLKENPSIFEQIGTWLKQSLILVIVIAALLFLVPMAVKFFKKTVL
jgi:hypothetical protein